jgi:uracil-DNA glycosylase
MCSSVRPAGARRLPIKPTLEEIRNCRPWLEQERALLPAIRVVVVLGRIAFDDYLTLLYEEGRIQRRAAFVFGHNRVHDTGPGLPKLISSYHPSQQNTQTGKLTPAMFREVFVAANSL